MNLIMLESQNQLASGVLASTTTNPLDPARIVNVTSQAIVAEETQATPSPSVPPTVSPTVSPTVLTNRVTNSIPNCVPNGITYGIPNGATANGNSEQVRNACSNHLTEPLFDYEWHSHYDQSVITTNGVTDLRQNVCGAD